MDHNFYKLPVREVRRETSDAVTVFFEVPDSLKETFSYIQGQYLTLRFTIDGEEVRRAYSMSSSPLETDLAVTVKEVSGGKVSPLINRSLKAGDEVEVMPPMGRFYVDLDPDLHRTFYFFGAGSGITPLMSIIKTTLEEEPKSTIHLLYGSRNETSIIFQKAIDELEKRYAGQFQVTHILSRPAKVASKGIGGLFKKDKFNWEGQVGRIDAKVVKKFLKEHPKRTSNAAYFICGPTGMMQTIERTLLDEKVDKKEIHLEYFTTATEGSTADTTTTTTDNASAARVQVILDGQEINIEVPAGKTILDVLIAQKYDPPYSCTSGTCSSCIAKVTKGAVEMEVCLALDEDEIEEGYILSCQAKPTTEEVHITYEV